MARTHRHTMAGKRERETTWRVADWPVPAWYTRLLRQGFRAAVKRALQRGQWDVLPKEKKSAGYYW